MDTNSYQLIIDVLITPVWFNRAPTGRIGINNQLKEIAITTPTWYTFEHTGSKSSTVTLQLEHYGKTVHDSYMQNNQDTALIIDTIKLNGISSRKFIQQAQYTPTYPDYYVAQNPGLANRLTGCSYLGWNGLWELQLNLPIYSWIHKVEELGWIYD